jgi:hypothetical protein
MTTIIESLTDRAAYIALGASNTTPGATDDETVTWALEATRARIADTATDEDRARILAWVREGEFATLREIDALNDAARWTMRY